ncbi:unnamed protein product [Gadus morhua 'NCC']
MTSVNWITPNGTLMTHGSYRVRISVLHDGTLNFTNVTLRDTGQYTCMVTNAAGNTNATAVLNVTAADVSVNYTYFTTVTVGDVPGPPGPTFTVPITEPGFSGLDDVMKTTKIIIGCFVAITFMAAVMLVVFYKLRKQHQLHKHHGPTRAIEIINVEDELGGGGGGAGGRRRGVCGGGLSGGSTVSQSASGQMAGARWGGGQMGGGQSLRLHHPEMVNLPNLARSEHSTTTTRRTTSTTT